MSPFSDPEKQRAAQARWRERNREKKRQADRDYKARNPEAVREAMRLANARYRAAHPERVVELAAKVRAANREKIAAASKRRREAEPEKSLAREAVRQARRGGRLVRLPCAVCREPKAQAHHYLGYERRHWLDVVWLCALHHNAAHRQAAA